MRRVVTIVLRDLSKYSDLVQGLAEVPVSSLGDTRMGVSSNDDLRAEARTKAIEQAKAKAQTIASQFGAPLGDIYSISETNPEYYGDGRVIAGMACVSSERQCFEPGTIDVVAQIYAVFRIKPNKQPQPSPSPYAKPGAAE